MKTKHRLAGYLIVGAVLLLLFFLAKQYLPDIRQFASPDFVREYLLSLGGWGYSLYLVLFTLSIPFPIPSMPLAIGAGYVFSFWTALLLTMLGVMMGSSISFWLVRFFGEPLLEKVVSKHHIVHFNHIFRRRGVNGAIIALAIPVFPADSINFILGLTRIRYHTFVLVSFLGNLPRYVLVTALGYELLTGFTLKTIFVPLACAVFVLIAVFRERIKKIVFKELRLLETEVEKEVKEVEKEVGKEVKWVEKEVEEELKGKKRRKKERSGKGIRRGAS